jgi:hypothetical protein
MGIKTKAFGPMFWVMLEGMAEFFDTCMEKAQEQKVHQEKLSKWICWFTSLIYCVGFILPCIYCRISYRAFLNPKLGGIQVDQLLKQPHGAKYLIYLIHDKVNEKLYTQALLKVEEQYQKNNTQTETEQQLFKQIKSQEIIQFWRQYRISFEEAQAKRFTTIMKPRFWYGYFMALCYSLSDYERTDPSECQHIWRFMILWYQLLTHMYYYYSHSIKDLVQHFSSSFQSIHPLCKMMIHQNEKEKEHEFVYPRLQVMHMWMTDFTRYHQWSFTMTFDTLIHHIQENMVKKCA